MPGTTPETANVLARVEYLRDPSGTLSFKDLLRPSADDAFRTYNRPYFLASDAQAIHWFRFDVKAAPNAPYRATLYFTDPRLTTAIVFKQVVAANADVFRYDPALAADDTVTKQAGLGFPIRLEANTQRTIYLALQGTEVSGTLELWEPAALSRQLKRKALGAYALFVALALALALGFYMAVALKKPGGITLSIAALSYSAYLSLGFFAFAPPGWLGSLNLSLLFGAVFAASALRLAIQPLMTDAAVPFLGWWSVVLGCAIVVAAILSAFLPAPAILFNYVLTAALVLASLFGVIVLMTLKTVPAYKLAALLALLFAACMAVVPTWPMNLNHMEFAASWLTVATLLCSGLYMVIASATLGARASLGNDEMKVASVDDSGDVSTFPELLKAAPVAAVAEPAAQTFSSPEAGDDVSETSPRQPGDQTDFQEASVQPSTVDDMTGVLNAVTIEALGQKTIAQVKRYRRYHTAIMLRIDDYEEILTALGQPTSDRAVKLLAVTSMRDLRESDALGRVRADTFVALLPESDLPGAYVALARMKLNLDERTLPTRAGMRKLSVTFAASVFNEQDTDFETIVERLEADLSSDIPSTDALTSSTHAAE